MVSMELSTTNESWQHCISPYVKHFTVWMFAAARNTAVQKQFGGVCLERSTVSNKTNSISFLMQTTDVCNFDKDSLRKHVSDKTALT